MNKNEVIYPTAGPSRVLNWPDVVLKGYVTFVDQSLGLPFFEDLN